MIRERPLYVGLIKHLAFRHGKMAFLAGPRQVGKTTIARQILAGAPDDGLYFTWEDPAFRRTWMKDPASLVPRRVAGTPVIVLDELHKAPQWKNRLKGLWDLRGEEARIVVTGSARLDVFRRGGDSLVGRYFLFRAHPFSLGELGEATVAPADLPAAVARSAPGRPDELAVLLEHGGFPEPFLKRDAAFTSLWRRTRTERLVREDLRDLNRVAEISLVEAAVSLLPERVGSPFSMKSLAEDLEVSPSTIKRWMEWLSRVYLVHRVPPYDRSVARSLKKQPKVYFWDWSEVPEPAARFENLVAGHLLKAVHAWTDSGLGTFDLRYVRDKEKREVDFLLLRDRRPWMLVECKTSDTAPSAHLLRFADVLGVELVLQVVAAGGIHEWFAAGKGRRGHVVSADSFLRLLP
ncbi:MAG: ATP-binding protein [Deltaproteobacteria bacterium]|nr:ATP-binding protein [Deltaproteobacteria bacterium]